MTPPTPKDVHRYDFDGDYGYCGCTISAYNNGDYVLYTDYLALAAERDAMKAERDAWEHRAEVAERENGDALAMLAFTGETSLWQAAAATRAKRDEAVRERDDADDALAACQAQAAGTIARLREALDKW
ncbi:MAG: hypothetical protein ACOVSI_05565, partial [Gemmatimonas sp.]